MATSWASKAVGPNSGLWRKIISWLALHFPASIEFMPFLFSYLPHVENQVLWTQLMFGIGLAFSLSVMQSHSQLPCNVNPGWGFPRLPAHSWKVKQIWTLPFTPPNTQLNRRLWQGICTKGLWTGDEVKNPPKDHAAWEYVWKDEKETKWKPYFWIGKCDRTEQNRAL